MAPKHRLYTPEIAETILERIADGEALRAICADDGIPTEGAVRAWAIDDIDGFGARFARAREIGFGSLAEDILEIGDTAKDRDSAAAARVRCDQRKWLLERVLPRIYGNRIDVNHTGEMTLKAVPDDKLESRLADLLGKAGTAGLVGGTGAAQKPTED